MSRIYKLLGDPEYYRHLWENREALEKYLKRLKELMEENEKDTESDNGDINNQSTDKESCK